MNDHELSAALRSFHLERTRLPDPPELHERVLATRFDDIGQRRSWLPSPSTRRFDPVFSATKLVAAGAIVALFGGVLLTGILPTGPADQAAPAAVSTTAATSTAAMTPTDASETTTTPDVTTDRELVPGVDLEVEEVAPGIYRVLSDGHHDLRRDVWDVAVTPGGEVWVQQHRVVYNINPRNDAVRTWYRDRRILQLGVPETRWEAGNEDPQARLYLDLEAGVPRISASSSSLLSRERLWQDGAWRRGAKPRSPRLPRCSIAPDGACWSAYAPDSKERSTLVKRTDTGDGSEQVFTRDDLGLDAEGSIGGWFAFGPDGAAWTDVHDGMPHVWSGIPDTFAGLATYDGEGWTFVEAPATGLEWVGSLTVAPDGDVWVAGGDIASDDAGSGGDGTVIARYDGERWDLFPRLDGLLAGSPGVSFAPDGIVWFDPVTYFDGSEIRRLRLPDSLTVGELRIGEHSVGPDGSVWTVLIDVRSPDELGCEAQPDRCEGVSGLYVITPEALEAAR